MSPRGRIHRLPQRLDYTLIPAPLDLSLPEVTEKSPLPAIIVTPSSPSGESDFCIAFLAPPPKPSLRERIRSSPIAQKFAPDLHPPRNTARLFILTMLVLLVLALHVITHRWAVSKPHLDFRVMAADGNNDASWFGFRELWNGEGPVAEVVVDERDFVVVEDLTP